MNVMPLEAAPSFFLLIFYHQWYQHSCSIRSFFPSHELFESRCSVMSLVVNANNSCPIDLVLARINYISLQQQLFRWQPGHMTHFTHWLSWLKLTPVPRWWQEVSWFVPSITQLPNSTSRVLLEKLIVTQLVSKFPAVYRTRRFITVFSIARRWFVSWARWIHSTLFP
jgi:hypothetical protein